jgi:hypothetical protein
MQSRVMPENCGTSSGRQCGLSSGLLPTMETDLPFPMPGECPRLETGRGHQQSRRGQLTLTRPQVARAVNAAASSRRSERAQARPCISASGDRCDSSHLCSSQWHPSLVVAQFEIFLGGASFRLPWSRGEKANNLQKRADDYQFEADKPCPRFEPVGRDDYRLHCSRRLAGSNEFRRQLRASGQHTQNNQC